MCLRGCLGGVFIEGVRGAGVERVWGVYGQCLESV